MRFNHTDEAAEGKLYSKEVLKLLFHYIRSYKKYLFIALFFVFVITTTNLLVPYYLKNVIDQIIFKQGRLVQGGLLQPAGGKMATRLMKRGKKLSSKDYFIFKSKLGYFSKLERKKLQESGIISQRLYLLVESPRLDPALEVKVIRFMKNGQILFYAPSTYLFHLSILSSFTVAELAFIRATDVKHITLYVALIILMLIIQFGASYIQIFYLMKLAQLSMKDLRKDLFSYIISLEVSYFDNNPIGKLVNRITNDIETLNEFFSSVLVTLLQDLCMMLGIAVIMFTINFHLACMVATTFPLIVLFTALFRLKARNAYRWIRTKIAGLNSFLNETITGIRIIQIFVQEKKNYQRFINKNNSLFGAQMKQLVTIALFRPLIGFLRWMAIAAVIYYGANGILDGTISYGLLVMFIAYIERFFAPVRDLSEKFDIMQSATAAGEKILTVFHTPERTEDYHLLPSIEKKDANSKIFDEELGFKGNIEFRNVWFSYKPGEWVLKGVNFTVKAGQTVALVGETGAGKSTVINILSKFYRLQRGAIYIDRKNLAEIPVSVIRRNIITVMQDIFLFSRPLVKNIILGHSYEQGHFEKVIRLVHLEQFLERLPDRENEPVMERGVTFSGGERQLISFARALYFNPPVLVLDEATSSIDTETERLIQDAIEKLTRDRTSIVIAHRLSTVVNADKIFVLERGKIVEQGTHQELIKRKGIYYRLYSLQSISIA